MERKRPSEEYSRYSPTRDRKGATCQNMERKRLSEGYSLSENRGGRAFKKEEERVRGTHPLETAMGGTCQDAERNNRARATHSLGAT